jgi:hypothetical protein
MKNKKKSNSIYYIVKIHRPWVGSNHQPSGINTMPLTAERASQLRHRGVARSVDNILDNFFRNSIKF